jgi:CubicO group peptidase (beta-lactamase class C family)
VRRMTRWIGLGLLLSVPVVLWLINTPRVDPVSGAGHGRPDIDRLVADRLTSAHLPGAAIAVTRGDRVIHVRGFGRTGDGEPVRTGTRFRIASLSKAFTATALLQLADANRVRLDAPVRTYLPRFQVDDPRGGAITVRHLLNQTSGMADAGFPEQTMAPPGNLSQRVASLHTARLVSTPGTRFHYFNPNYDVLARLVEVTAGQPYEAYLRTEIFEPLGMSDTTVMPTERTPPAGVRPDAGHLLVYGVAVARPELHGFLGGNGAIVSTAEDLAHWLIAQSTGQYGGHRLLSPAGMDLLRTVPAGIDTTYGMGWVVERAADGTTRLTHTGVLSTYYAEAMVVPRTGTAVVLLFNSYNALAPYHPIVEGVAALLDGRAPATGLPFAAIELPLACLTVLVLGTRSARLARSRSWAAEHRNMPVWRILLTLAWLLLPTVVLIALPDIVAFSTDRVFSRHQLLRSMPGVHGLLGTTALTGLALATVRMTLLVRRPRPRAGQDLRAQASIS